MDHDAIPTFLAEQRENAPDELQHYFLSCEDYWERKLWHELTAELQQLYAEPASAPLRAAVFDSFISTFAAKINQLQLVTLGLGTSAQLSGDDARLPFLQALVARVNKAGSQDAYVYALTAVAATKLRLDALDDAAADLDACETILDTFDAVEGVVHASFYRTRAALHQRHAAFADYYRATLLYLACVELGTLPGDERQRIAHDLALAALVSDSLHNFGELLLHPILASLADTPHAWLRDLLAAFTAGDQQAFAALSPRLATIPLLAQHEQALRQKLRLAALTQLVFSRAPQDRALTFAALSAQTNVPPAEIEILLMQALALGLVRGSIDQVAQVARVLWVRPKVLDRGQIEGLRGRLREWGAGVERLGVWVEGRGRDVWAA